MTRRKATERMSPGKIRELAFSAGELCLEKKATDVVLLDLKNVSQMTDYFLLAGGHTDIHVRSVGEYVQDQLREKFAVKPWHVEGMENGRWVLLDYVDFVVHVMQPDARSFYQLEKLWIDAERHDIGDGDEEPVGGEGPAGEAVDEG